MALKDYFNDDEPINIIPKQSLVSASKEVESVDFLVESTKDKNRYIPQVDYSDPRNFAFFGSAEEYYTQAIKYIRDDYPYDGSYKEKAEWKNSVTYLDLYFFDKEYPRTNGFVTLSNNGWGTQSTSVKFKTGNLSMSLPATQEYILFKGGPNVDNIYSVSENREENLKYDLSTSGLTVEFWSKIDQVVPVSSSGGSDSIVLFDLWNGKNTDNPNYGRFSIGLNNNLSGSNSIWFVHAVSGSTGAAYQSGTAGFFDSYLQSDIEDDTWHHYAFTAINSGSDLKFGLYVDGNLKDTATIVGQAIGKVTGSMLATIGATVAFPDWTTSQPGTAVSPLGRGYGKFSGSIDEFRFWKRKRNAKEIGRYHRSQVGGGTNTDDSNVDLGVYFKFNEGITTNLSDDAIVLDYSGRVSNGSWTGYTAGARSTESAIVQAGAATYEFKDPIVKSGHPAVSNLLAKMAQSGSEHDLNNNSYMYFSYPSHIIEEDEAGEGNLKILTHIMGSYFDTLYLQIETLKTLKTKNYISSSYKPYPHSNRLLSSVGFVAPNIFVDANILEQFDKRSETVLFEENLYDIKNTIYQNIYNNIDYIYKSKGTIKSFRNLLRCYGVDQELIKFNLYSSNATHDLETDYEGTSVKKNFANFNDVDRNRALIYQSGTFPGITAAKIKQTTECEVLFPRKLKESQKNFYFYPNLSSSLFGAMASGSNVSGAFGAYAVRTDVQSSDVKFVLSSAFGYLASDVYRGVYDNQKWNFSVRVKPLLPKTYIATFGNEDYIIQFTGINTVAGRVINQFILSSSVDSVYVDDLLNTNKRMYVGASYDTISGSSIHPTDVKISYLRHWFSDLTIQELKAHGIHPYNYGATHPYEDAGGDTLNVSIPKIETLALNWDFQSASVPDSLGMFVVPDFSSGSISSQSLYGFLGPFVKRKNDGVGRFYLQNDSGSIDKDYVHVYKPRPPESLNSLDMIQIGEDRDTIFTKETRPVDYFWAFEKSLAQNVSEEILNIFGTIKDFNNLIGEPVNRYRPEYKDMQKLRQLFFMRMQTDIDFERYVEFYRWIDSSLNSMLEKLIPISANTSDRIRTVVESHVLERAKVWTKFPTIEFKQNDIVGQIDGANKIVDSWKYNHHPEDGDQQKNLQWWDERAERDKVLATGDSTFDSQRETLREINTTETQAQTVTLYDIKTSQTYEGSTDALRKSRPYRIEAFSDPIQRDRKPSAMALDYAIRNGKEILGGNVTVGTNDDEQYKKIPEDEFIPEEFRRPKRAESAALVFNVGTGFVLSSKNYNYKTFLPFKIFSSSIGTGYQSGLTIAVERYHDDDYGYQNDIPMQGPFTEKFVGGHPSRHYEIIPPLQNSNKRPERWRLGSFTSASFVVGPIRRLQGPGGIQNQYLPEYSWYRDEFAKRPLNIRNISYNTASSNKIGNFQKNYQVVMTSGRLNNNLWFREQNGVLSTSSQESTTVSGVIDFTLPDRGSQKTVIVERFSAPGDPSTMSRGYLDTVSEEYSAYNQLNYRNISVRQPLQSLLSRHCGQFGFDSVVGEPNASFHKVNRNTLTRLEWSGSSDSNNIGAVLSGSVRDNWYVQHQIPRSDRQYAWITGSLQSWSPNGVTDTN